MYCCLPFFKPKVLMVEEPRAPQPKEVVLQDPVKHAVSEDPSPAFIEVPEILRIRQPTEPLRIPDALMDIRNPSIKAQFKEFCKNHNLCVACSYMNPNRPTVLVFNGLLYECPHCDSDVDSP